MTEGEQNLSDIDDRQRYLLRRRVDIGQRVRAVRRRRQRSQEEVADYLGCSRMKVMRVENGTTEFSVVELELLARFLDVSILHFLGIAFTVTFQGDSQTYELLP